MNKLTIGTRLASGFVVLLFLITALTGVGLWNIDAASQGSQNDTARIIFISLALATLLIGIILAITITRSIVRPLNDVIRLTQAVASHDLTLQIHAHGHDETGMLLRTLQQMTHSLHGMAVDIRHGAYAISAASRQIRSGNTDLSSRTEEQASSLTETAAAMEQLTATVRQNADNAQQANTLAMTAADVAIRGGEIVSQVVTTMDSINASSKKVEDIIGVIDSIAFQTNILALNAAVESARAGEAGRGFAVVASEVRSLAQRSAQAAHEIKELITASVNAAATGNRLVNETGSTMTEIVESIQRVTDIMGEITAASQEQTTGIEQVNNAVLQLDQATRQNATLVQEAESTTNTMQTHADQLAHIVTAFKLKDQVSAANKPSVSLTQTSSPVRKPASVSFHKTEATTRKSAAAAPQSQTALPGPQPATRHNAGAAPETATPVRTTASGVTVGAFQTSAGAVEEWEEF